MRTPFASSLIAIPPSNDMRWIDRVGLTPDVPVALEGQRFRAGIAGSDPDRDAQLQAAVAAALGEPLSVPWVTPSAGPTVSPAVQPSSAPAVDED